MTGAGQSLDLLGDLKNVIRYASDNAARSQQTALGPSEVGHPCARKLVYGLMGEPKINESSDPWPSIRGTALHTWLENALRLDNERLGRVRWIPEQKVGEREGLRGTCDVYDIDTATVLDWKAPGVTRHKLYKKNGPSTVYRRQAHIYGAGYTRMGFPVHNVGIVFLPGAGYSLEQTYMWTEPYDPKIEPEVGQRINDLTLLAADLDLEHNPDNYQHIPRTPDDCEFCPWFSPVPTTSRQCDGEGAEPRTQFAAAALHTI